MNEHSRFIRTLGSEEFVILSIDCPEKSFDKYQRTERNVNRHFFASQRAIPPTHTFDAPKRWWWCELLLTVHQLQSKEASKELNQWCRRSGSNMLGCNLKIRSSTVVMMSWCFSLQRQPSSSSFHPLVVFILWLRDTLETEKDSFLFHCGNSRIQGHSRWQSQLSTSTLSGLGTNTRLDRYECTLLWSTARTTWSST